MKPLAKNLSGSRVTRVPSREPGLQSIQMHGLGRHPCRTNCGAGPHGGGARPGNPNLNRAKGVATPGFQSAAARGLVRSGPESFGSKAANYRVQTPIPLGSGGQQIRATIHGTAQIAGSVEISSSGSGRAYISNLKVEQQHRRQGIAGKLIDAAVATARRQGFKAASLEARPSDNGISPQALVAMYRRQGFKSVGRSVRGSPMMERKL